LFSHRENWLAGSIVFYMRPPTNRWMPMATCRPEVTGRSEAGNAEVETNPLKFALTIREFCSSHNISLAFFYLLQQRGEGPRVMHVGGRRLISIEEARCW